MFISKGRRSGRIAVTVACAVIGSFAWAGNHYSQPSVSITSNADGTGSAMGTLGGVRNSASTVERLACTVQRSETLNAAGSPVRTTAVSCLARDAKGVSATCISRLEKHAVTLTGITNDSLIEFHWDAAGTCTTLWVYESSSMERKRQ